MSSVIISVPDDGWFQNGCNVKPQDKMLCVIMHRYGDRTPSIAQYRKSDYLYKDSDYFLDISEQWELDSIGCGDEWEPGFYSRETVDYWKPLALPDEDNERIINKIDKLFEEDE